MLCSTSRRSIVQNSSSSSRFSSRISIARLFSHADRAPGFVLEIHLPPPQKLRLHEPHPTQLYLLALGGVEDRPGDQRTAKNHATPESAGRSETSCSQPFAQP